VRMLLVALVAGIVVMAPVTAATAKEIDKDFHESFDVKEGVRLRLEHGDGDVIITPWDKDVIDVKVRYHAEIKTIGFGSEPDFNVEFRQTEDSVFVSGLLDPDRVVIFRSSSLHEYTYTISAPAYVLLDLRGDDGDVEIRGWRGNIECDIDDGDVELTDIVNAKTRIGMQDGDLNIEALEGELTVIGDDGDVDLTGCTMPYARLRIQDGDITIRESKGDLEVDVDDGDVSLYRVESNRIEVRSNDGDVDLDLLKSSTIDLDVTTDDGSVLAILDGSMTFEFLITMDDGRVNVNLPNVADLDESEHRVSGRVGDDGGRVRIRTQDGGVTLRASR